MPASAVTRLSAILLALGVIAWGPARNTPLAAESGAAPGQGSSQQGPGAPFAVPSTIRVGIAHGSTYDVQTLTLESYVAGVLAGESARGSSPAALEALAITIRTFALANLGRHRADGFDLCDQTHCQVFRAATSATERAAEVTAGQVLTYRGGVASVFYSASCGGHTALPSEVWPGAENPPYLPSRKDAACDGDPAWTDDLTDRDLARALTAAGFRGSLRGMRIAARDGSGRVARVALDGLSPPEISGQDLRSVVGRTLGWQHIKSAAFELERERDSYRLSGNGSGHGVGLCVMGSVKLAEAGEAAPAILGRYFPGAVVTPVAYRTAAPPPLAPLAAARAGGAPPSVSPVAAAASLPDLGRPSTSPDRTPVVSLPRGDEGDERALAAMASRARDEVARTLGVEAPSHLSLRFHPTTDDYERATGRSWFTSGTVVNDEMHFVPLVSLRDRGILERTIRREVVHVIVDPVLADRPAWVREGAALYFSDQPATSSPSRGRISCPTDAELLSPVSLGGLADVYARARSCFARQMAAGRSWRDVK